MLVELKEYNTDQLIPSFVQSQEISRQIIDTFSFEDIHNGEIRGEFLTMLTANGFMRDLDRLQLDVPPDFKTNSKYLIFSI
jgi:hypothetical protein